PLCTRASHSVITCMQVLIPGVASHESLASLSVLFYSLFYDGSKIIDIDLGACNSKEAEAPFFRYNRRSIRWDGLVYCLQHVTFSVRQCL
ncbi:hypothetical protein JI435_400290, partial [Parastagonospora nodorum SN15]